MSEESKRCAICGTVRSLDYFAIDRTSIDGHKTKCVACSQPELWAKVQTIKTAFAEDDETKCCYTCREIKGVSQFGVDRTKPDGLSVDCLSCVEAMRTGLPEPRTGFFATIRETWARLRVVSAMKQAEQELRDVQPGPEKMETFEKRIEEILKTEER
jgi:hypothetical protein